MNWFCCQVLRRVYGRVMQEAEINMQVLRRVYGKVIQEAELNTFSIVWILVQSDQGIKPSNSQSLKPSHLPNALLHLSTNGTSSLDTSSGLSLNQIGSLSLFPSDVPSFLPRSFKHHSLGPIVVASLCILLALDLSAKSTVVPDSVPTIVPSLVPMLTPSTKLPSIFLTPVLFNPSLLFKLQELGGW